MQKKCLLVLSTLFLLAGCVKSPDDTSSSQGSSSNTSTTESSSSSVESSTTSSESSSSSSVSSPVESSSSSVSPEPMGPYTPTSFDVSTYKTETTNITDGVDLVKIQYTLTSANTEITVYVVEADPAKVKIAAGTTNNATTNIDAGGTLKLAVPYDQALAYTSATKKKFYAVTNADFFSWEGRCVNAFAKDGKIIKSSHNSDLTDIPESKPMLFGVTADGHAQIAPIVKNKAHGANNNATITSSLFYGVDIYTNDGTIRLASKANAKPGDNEAGIISNDFVDVAKGRVVLEITKDETNSDKFSGVVKSVRKLTAKEQLSAALKQTRAYITLPETWDGKVNVGDKILAGYINTEDDTWFNYETIIGCRHSLIENGKLPETIYEEGKHTNNHNGVLNRVPRSAVGIKENGHVVIASVEDLHYNSKNNVSVCTGLTIVQMADVLRYYGCYSAANFDGGGSSQLITWSNANNAYEVITRSSDKGVYELSQSRSVLNSIIVAEK